MMKAPAGDERDLIRRCFKLADVVVCAALALLLTGAAVAKAISEQAPIKGPFALELVVFVEVVAGLALVFHRASRASRLAVGVMFTGMAVYAISAATRGSHSCGCLGAIQVPPAWLGAVDASAGIWLLAGCLVPPHLPSHRPAE